MQFTTEEFDSLWHRTARVLIKTGISLLLYGIYICLFLLSIRVLSRRAAPGRKILIVSSCVMAVVGTMTMAIEIAVSVISAHLVQELVHGGSLNVLEYQTLGSALWLTSIINLFVSDSFFLYRCYVIWGYQKKVAILLAVLILSTFAVGIFPTVTDNTAAVFVTYGLAAATNVILTTLTAGRILWVRRHTSRFTVDAKLRGRYNTAIKLVLESGAIYCIGIIFLLASFLGSEDIYLIGTAFGEQALNIIPTFTLVYVGLNNSGDPAEEK
ncbi:hypothetical protein B0H14DRAFT_3868428 [Mycena olivaceomarginata]|nr:hypothetical protein B0H14DRAFT_3868428 [Mycena olivaceomarginata]